jgi:hypothetical protein
MGISLCTIRIRALWTEPAGLKKEIENKLYLRTCPANPLVSSAGSAKGAQLIPTHSFDHDSKRMCTTDGLWGQRIANSIFCVPRDILLQARWCLVSSRAYTPRCWPCCTAFPLRYFKSLSISFNFAFSDHSSKKPIHRENREHHLQDSYSENSQWSSSTRYTPHEDLSRELGLNTAHKVSQSRHPSSRTLLTCECDMYWSIGYTIKSFKPWRLSAQLYDSSTHFCGNFYKMLMTMNMILTWHHGYSWAMSLGTCELTAMRSAIRQKNVEAICTIRSSTKSGGNHESKTAEKGIGSKSVFKIVKIVRVPSREYAFKFDKTLDFGMIAPIWEEFPRSILTNHTSFLLQLDESYDEDQIVDSLQNFDHTHLLFLKRLRHVTLNVQPNGSRRTIQIRRRDEIREDVPVTIIKTGERESSYITLKKQVQHLPKKKKKSQTRRCWEFWAHTRLPKERRRKWGSRNVFKRIPTTGIRGGFAGSSRRQHHDWLWRSLPQRTSSQMPERARNPAN